MFKVTEPGDLLETSRGPEARQREEALEVSVFLILSGACYSVRRKNSQNNGYFSNLRECAIEDRAAIEASCSDASKIAERSKHRGAIFEASRASRSDAIEDRGVIEASRSDAPGDRSIAKRCYRRSRSDRSIAKRCSRGIADDDAPGKGTRRREAPKPPRASSSSDCRCPPGIIYSPSRVSNFHLAVAFRPCIGL